MKFKHLLFLSFILFGIFTLQSQEKKPLKLVLIELEKKYNIKFSFSEDELTTKTIDLDLSKDSLDDILKKISQITQLQFKKITERYIAISNSASTINISGKLIDTNTGLALAGGTIKLLKNEKGTVSDQNGYYKLNNVSENDSIAISYLGYKEQLFLAKELKNNAKILLSESSNQLNEIIIKNYLTSGMVKKNDGSEEFRPENLGVLPGLTEPDVLQSIQLLPGVQSPNETASGLHIRGGTPDQNLILFDGIKMYNSAHFFGMISAFNPYITNKTKVYRSGASASYGNHISGVIDIRSDDKKPDSFSGGIGTNLVHSDAFIKTPIGKNAGLILAGRRSFTDLFNTITFEQMSKKVFQNTVVSENNQEEDIEVEDRFNEFFYSDLNAKIFVNASDKDLISLSFLHNSNELNYSLDEDNISNAVTHFLRFFNLGTSLQWERKWNSKLKQKTNIYYSDFDLNYNFNRSDQDELIEDILDKKNNVNELQVQSVFNASLTKKSVLNFGYEFTHNKVQYLINYISFEDNENDLISNMSQNNSHALFGEYRYTKSKKTSLHLGLRSNYFSLTNSFFLSPRLYAQHQISNGLWLKTTAELKQQNISKIVEFFTIDFGLENQIWALADIDEIPVLKSNQFSFGFIYKKNNWTLDIDAYRKGIEGLTSLRNGFQVQSDNYSEGKSTSLGLDVFLKKQWNNYSSWISYTLSDTSFVFDDINNGNPFTGNYNTKHQLLWAHNLKLNSFNFSLGWNFRTGIPYTNATGIDSNSNIIYETINAEELSSYHKLDFSTTYQFNLSASKRWEGKIGFSLLNIYNQKNILQRSFRIKEDSNGDDSLVKTDTYSLGITPNMVIRINF